MSNDKDAAKLVILKVDYMELVVPVEAAMAFIKLVAGGSTDKLHNKWINETKSSIEVFEHVDLSIHHLSPARYALAKMSTASLKEDK
jgi:hypothetical protein